MPTWMAVEDERDINEVILGMFEAWGVDGILFDDGNEAAAWIETIDMGMSEEELPVLALLDVRVPSVSGIQLSARLRRSPFLWNMSIALMTAYQLTPEDEAKAMAESGADILLYKPLPHVTDLRKLLDSIVKQRQNPSRQKSKL